MIKDNRIFLSTNYEDRLRAKAINGARWHKDFRMWSWPIASVRDVMRTFPQHAEELRGIKEEKGEQGPIPTYKIKVPDYLIDYKFPVKPFKHQVEMVKCWLKYRQFAYFGEMGTGKTYAAIASVSIMIHEGAIKRCLVLCPLSVTRSWSEQLPVYAPGRTWSIQKNKKTLDNSTDFVIMGYERFLSMHKAKMNFDEFDCIILDESHRIKGHDAQISKAIVKAFAGRTCHKLIMTGTPYGNNAGDLFMQGKFLDEALLGHSSYFSFRDRHMVMGGYGGYQVLGMKNREELARKLAKFSYQIKKEDCIDLPPKTYKRLYCEMSEEMRQQYKQMEKNLVLELEDETITASVQLAKILRLQQILSGVHLTDKAGNNKLALLKTFLEDHPVPTIVWCRYLETIAMLKREIGDKAVVFNGELSVDDRDAAITAFMSGKAQVFIGQIQAGGLGLNLQRAENVIYYENVYSLINRKQSEDRAHRPGQTKSVCIIDMLYEGTLEPAILKALSDKQDGALALINSFKKGEYK